MRDAATASLRTNWATTKNGTAARSVGTKDAWARPFHYALTVDGYLLSGVDNAGRQDAATVIERVVAADRP